MLLTEDMENELNHWVAISQRTSAGVEQDSVCRVAFASMASDPIHCAKVQADHKEYLKPDKKSVSRDWFFAYRKKYPMSCDGIARRALRWIVPMSLVQ